MVIPIRNHSHSATFWTSLLRVFSSLFFNGLNGEYNDLHNATVATAYPLAILTMLFLGLSILKVRPAPGFEME